VNCPEEPVLLKKPWGNSIFPQAYSSIPERINIFVEIYRRVHTGQSRMKTGGWI